MAKFAEIEKLKAELSVNLNDLEWMTEQRDKLQAEVDRIKELEAENEKMKEANRWIPVAERLPDDGVPVLVTYLGYYDNKPYSDGVAKWKIENNGYNGGWEWELDGDEVKVQITHWRPLPEPPEPEKPTHKRGICSPTKLPCSECMPTTCDYEIKED